jgi:Flp pilus assembly protein CpaB
LSRITPGIVLVVFFALVIGLAGAYAMKRLLSVPPPQVQVKVEPKPEILPVAAMDLPRNRVITTGDFMQVAFLPADRQRLPAVVLNNGNQMLGRMLREPVKIGEGFPPSIFYGEGTEPTAAERVKPGYRAVTVAITADGALAGQAVPGSLVDVVFRARPDKVQDIPEMTTVLVQNAEILALGDNATPGLRGGLALDKDDKLNDVMLEVKPEQARELKMAEGRGDLSLVLRSTDDPAAGSLAGPLTLRELLNVPPRAEPFVVEIYRAGRRQTLTFDGDLVAKEEFGGVDHKTDLPPKSTTPPPMPEEPSPNDPPTKPKPSDKPSSKKPSPNDSSLDDPLLDNSAAERLDSNANVSVLIP